jgi:hypothetical protein
LNGHEDRRGGREIWADVATRVLTGGHSAHAAANLADLSKRLTRRT